MDSKIKSDQRDAEEVKVNMLDYANKVEEHEEKLKDQRAEQLQSTSKTATLKNATKLKVNQKMEFMRANKGLLCILIVSAAIIIAVVIAMLVTKDKYEHRHSEVESVSEEPQHQLQQTGTRRGQIPTTTPELSVCSGECD